jgi:hypothetical protein
MLGHRFAETLLFVCGGDEHVKSAELAKKWTKERL